jgi:hypothetical protein
MSGNLVTDEYTPATDIPVPGWRREAVPMLLRGRISAKHRSRHVIQLPIGVITVDLPNDAEEPTWLLPALESLTETGSLRDNWNSYGARAVSPYSVVFAIRLLAMVMTETMPAPAFVPTRDGGMQLEWHTKGVDLEIFVSPAGRYRASSEDLQSGVEWAGDVTSNLEPIAEVLAKLAER